MKLVAVILALLSSLGLLPSACAQSSSAGNAAQGYHAVVKSVHDGDTIRVVNEHGQEIRIRMANIDAPELNQAYGKASRDALRATLQRQDVQVKTLETDQYGRQVAQIYLAGRDVNLQQIEQGNAWHYRSIAKRQQNAADFAQYESSENTAKAQRAGLWRDKNPVAPWTYRQQQRQRE